MSGVSQTASAGELTVERRSATPSARRRLARQPVAMISGFVLVAIFVVGALGPHFVSPALVHLTDEWRNHPPTITGWNLFGTDAIGENLLVRTLYGLHASEITAGVFTEVSIQPAGSVTKFSGRPSVRVQTSSSPFIA